jgi:hypothetical protein
MSPCFQSNVFIIDGLDEYLNGMIPRLIDDIFRKLNDRSERFDYMVQCCFLEIYNEKLHDLFRDPETVLDEKQLLRMTSKQRRGQIDN